MPQLSHAQPTTQPGRIGSSSPPEWGSIPNPRTAQVITIDVDGTTTDGTYTADLVDDNGQTVASVSYVAVSKTAAQIAAGYSAAILADPAFRGFIQSAPVAATDQVPITMLVSLRDFTLTLGGPSGPDVLSTTAGGFVSVPLGIILQADGTGGFSTTYTDAAVALGVTASDGTQHLPYAPGTSETPAYNEGQHVSFVTKGEVTVEVVSGVTVYQGNKAYFNSTTGKWSNATTGSHVLVEGAQWRTGGTGVQLVFVNLPSET